MNIIKTHDVTVYGSSGEYDIILRPLCDGNLPLLYKWGVESERRLLGYLLTTRFAERIPLKIAYALRKRILTLPLLFYVNFACVILWNMR